ncbi:MAG: ABC transporter permease [bacterium]
MLFKIYCLIKKEFLEEISYRLDFLLRIFSIFAFMLIFFYIAKVFRGAPTLHLERYGGDYFSFVLIGLAFVGYMQTGLSTFSDGIRTEQTLGTLEAILATRTPITIVLLARLLWNFIYDTFHLAVYFTAGVLMLNAHYTASSLYLIPLILFLSLIAHSSLGMISAGFILVLKRGDPINTLFGMAAQLLGGVFFPITVLPDVLQKVSAFLPITYSLRLMREVCIRGAGFSEIATDLRILFLLSAALFPLSIYFFNAALRRTRIDGSLTHY